MIKMVRQPSETPNISNIDDIIPYRYAYGNQNGYVINRGSEVSYSINGTRFTINSGRLVLQGVESDIDANGEIITIDSASETRYYSIYYKVNLATNIATIEKTYSTGSYPTISMGDDLNVITSGTANLELYRFVATNGVISNVQKVVKAIEYGGTALNGYDISQGTIEERLTRLGFKEGSIATGDVKISDTADTYINIDNTTINIKRQGNYVLINMSLYIRSTSIVETFFKTSNTFELGSISADFRPKEDVSFTIPVDITSSGNLQAGTNYVYYSFYPDIALYVNISSDGLITLSNKSSFSANNLSGEISIAMGLCSGVSGYEANPIDKGE